MGLGILEPALPTRKVPGTVYLLQHEDSGQINLNPRPSDSPNDPLRWPIWRKHVVLLAISIGCGLCGIQGTCLAVATLPITEELEITLSQTQSFTAYSFISIAVGCALSAIFARVIGKRPVYLLSGAFGLAGAAWNATGTSYGSLLGSRILYGLGAGAFEALALATSGDLYFVHERGRCVAFFSFVALGCTQLSPVLGGYLTDTYGWRSQFWILLAFWIALMILIAFGCPETSFSRPARYETDIAIRDETTSPTGNEIEITTSEGLEKGGFRDSANQDPIEQRRSYARELYPYRRIHTGVNLVDATIHFFVTGLYPIVWFAFVILGSYLAWFIGINVTLAQIFGSPPILFTPTKIGYLNTFGFPGALAAEALLHFTADRSCKWLARRNNNIHEPEFRLFMIIPAIVIGVLSLALFGWYAGDVALEQEISWVAASFIFGMVVFALVNGQSVAFSYLLDAHREISIEAGMFAVMLRSFLAYGAGTFVPQWLEHSGVAHTFYEIAGLQGGLITIISLLMYVVGKRVRAFMAEHNPVRSFNLRI
ncbi:MAG: hypothetical protein M1820_006052 [Bogoriella megaspora]|nr:MAG: hypothetical protein M1820_006052 [Bogoriella megaspora]